MPAADVPPACRDAREWLSAFRDGEALDHRQARAHLDACGDCAGWAMTLDALTPRLRLRRAGSPDVASAAVVAWRRRAAASGRGQAITSRVLLTAAGAAGLTLALLGLSGVPGSSPGSMHLGWELYSFEASVAVGFLLAAWRPDRYTRALLPLVAAVAALTFVPSTVDVAASRADPLTEASHLPVLVGLLGLLVDLQRPVRRGGRQQADGGPRTGGLPA